MVFLVVGLIITERLLVASKLSSYRSTCPGNSRSLLGFHLAGIISLNPSPLYATKSVFFFAFPNTLAAKIFIHSHEPKPQPYCHSLFHTYTDTS